MIAEFFTTTERLVYLQKELKDKITVLSEPDESNQLRIGINIENSLDVMDVFHAGVFYGLDKMNAVFNPKQ